MLRIHDQLQKQQHVADFVSDTPIFNDEISAIMDYQGYQLSSSFSAEVSTGTTIMACEFDGGVILAADSRTSTGDYVANRSSRKISRLHDRIFVLRSGSAADTQSLTALVRGFLDQHATELGKEPTVNSAANLMRLVAYNNKDALTAGLIVAGWDQKRGAQVYPIPLGGSKFRKQVAIGGSGSGYITGLVDHLFKPNMTQKECRSMVTRCVSHAMARDGSSGGMIRLVTVTEADVVEEVIFGDHLPYKLGSVNSE